MSTGVCTCGTSVVFPAGLLSELLQKPTGMVCFLVNSTASQAQTILKALVYDQTEQNWRVTPYLQRKGHCLANVPVIISGFWGREEKKRKKDYITKVLLNFLISFYQFNEFSLVYAKAQLSYFSFLNCLYKLKRFLCKNWQNSPFL